MRASMGLEQDMTSQVQAYLFLIYATKPSRPEEFWDKQARIRLIFDKLWMTSQ